jgi:hypothetical protein
MYHQGRTNASLFKKVVSTYGMTRTSSEFVLMVYSRGVYQLKKESRSLKDAIHHHMEDSALEPLEKSPCSMTMAEVAWEDREQGWKKGDAEVGRHDLGYKGPRGGLSTPMAFNASLICQPPYSSPEGTVSVSHHASGRKTVSR